MSSTGNHLFRLLRERYFSDIRFWIILFFLLRMYGITNAPLEISHSWRQSLTNMVARNFLEIDNTILYPRIDMDGNKSGIIASEFPFFNYLIYIVSKIFGYAHWYGRLINLIISSAGVFYFYKLLKRFFTEEHAFYSSFILLVSIWFAFSRKSMPDTFCISLVIIGIYYGFVYLYEKRVSHLLLFTFITSLAILCKIPALYLLSVIIIPFPDKHCGIREKRNIFIACIVVVFLTWLWYFYWVPHLLRVYGFQLYFPRGFTEGLKELVAYGPATLEKFYFSALQSFTAFAVFIAGLLLIIRGRKKIHLWIFCIATLFFILFIIKTGFVFSVHNYYVIPYVPVMAFVAGSALVSIKYGVLRVALMTVIAAEGILNQHHDFRIKPTEEYKLGMEAIADKVSSRGDLFVINGGRNPQQMYFLHHRGWSVESEKLNDTVFTDSLKAAGCKYMLINLHEDPLPWLEKITAKEVFRDRDFIVYSLHN